MEIKYKVTGKDRKALVMAIAEITGKRAVYKRVPTCNYEVGEYIIDKAGTLICPDSGSETAVEHLLHELAQKGFMVPQKPTESPSESLNKPSNIPAESVQGFSVSLPIDKVNIDNLEHLLEAKKTLICKALGVEFLPVDVEETRVTFPWFPEMSDAVKVKTYTHFIAALCEMSVNQKRISPKEKIPENEKYAFRCFLLRLGFIGDAYKKERKILLENLSGSSAFKDGRAGAKR